MHNQFWKKTFLKLVEFRQYEVGKENTLKSFLPYMDINKKNLGFLKIYCLSKLQICVQPLTRMSSLTSNTYLTNIQPNPTYTPATWLVLATLADGDLLAAITFIPFPSSKLQQPQWVKSSLCQQGSWFNFESILAGCSGQKRASGSKRCYQFFLHDLPILSLFCPPLAPFSPFSTSCNARPMCSSGPLSLQQCHWLVHLGLTLLQSIL